MALSKGTNSYVTVAEADTYFLDRIDVAAWTAADEPTKSQALVTATSMLDNLLWTGTAITATQPLAFPRSGEYFDPKIGTTISIEDVPKRVITATMELAYHLINNDNAQDETGKVESIEVGPIKLLHISAPSKIPSMVFRLVQPLLVNAGASSWWRAN
jgi:hypothetical protein